jgi:excisionase family DNA binding protein
MTDATLAQDANALQKSLAEGTKEVLVTLSRETAEFVSRVIRAKAEGQEVIVTHGLEEVTPSEAAAILGMSRPQVRKLMERGEIPFRKVGSHHRIPLAPLAAWAEAERKRRKIALARYSEVQNELGLFE